MKRVGGLFDRIATRENLGRAFWAAAQGKRERAEVRDFASRLDENLALMSRDLGAGTYQFSPYRSFEVRDTKSRTIHAPVFRDRVAHHAILAVAGPVMEGGALAQSYACRKGLGQHRALRQAAAWTRRDLWYGKMGVRKFYDSIDHDILMGLLRRRFREQRLLSLFECLLTSYQNSPGRGLPIGALSSQYLGNFMLDVFDREMKASGLAGRYLRYMDDAAVWGRRVDLAPLRKVAVSSLGDLGLELKNGGEWNSCQQGVPFLGFVIYPDRIRLGKAGRKRLRRKFKELESVRLMGGMGEDELANRGNALFAHARVADDVAWRRDILRLKNFGEEQGPHPARRVLEQYRHELSCGLSQQEQARQPQQEQRVSLGCGPRHGEAVPSPDDAPSRAWSPASAEGRAEAMDKTPPDLDTPLGDWGKRPGGAPTDEGGHDE